MRKILVATHGPLADGFKKTVEMIVGDNDVEYLSAYMTNDFDIDFEVNKIVKSIKSDDSLIVLCDILGGSVCTAFSSVIRDNIHVIAGINLQMLLDFLLNQDSDVESVINRGINSSHEGIVYLNSALHENSIDMVGDDF